MTELDYLLNTQGEQRELDAHVVALAFDRAGQAAFGLGDGTVRLAGAQNWQTVEVGEGAVLDLVRDAAPSGWLCGTDDGGLVRVGADGGRDDLAGWSGKWVEHVAAFGQDREVLRACSVGRVVHVFNAAGTALKVLTHPSTVTGIAFDVKGKRLAASHYNGASLWFVGSKTDTPRLLEWKGSHTGLALHPTGDVLVTTMQENALHGWQLPDGQHMRMSGYPSKTESLSFTRNGRWLATSGADAIVLWPFFGGGPMGRAPTELAGGAQVLCTRVACHPQHELCAAGYADGTVLVVDIGTQRILPVAPAGHGAVTALAWSGNGAQLGFGTEHGFAALVDLAGR